MSGASFATGEYIEMSTAVERPPSKAFHVQNGRQLETDPFVALDEYRESPPFWCKDLDGFWV